MPASSVSSVCCDETTSITNVNMVIFVVSKAQNVQCTAFSRKLIVRLSTIENGAAFTFGFTCTLFVTEESH